MTLRAAAASPVNGYFGDYVSIHDIQRAVEDKGAVPIYYESHLGKLDLPQELKPRIDQEFEKVTEGEEVERKEKLKTKWAQLEAVVGAEKPLGLIAQNIVIHFERRLETMGGKGMVVCMSRRICVQLYNEIVRLRPEWHHDDDDKGAIKVAMTGSASDPSEWQPHIRNKQRRGGASPTASATPPTPSSWSSCATGGSRGSMPRRCRHCTWTGPYAPTG